MEQSGPYSSGEKETSTASNAGSMQPISLQPFDIQIQDIFPIEINVKRFPIPVNNSSIPMNALFNITELMVNEESLQAQVILDVKIEPIELPQAFEISFKLLALFAYNTEYTQETIKQFLAQGSLSLMLPFARELVLSLSTRLRLPPIVLSLIQLSPPDTLQTSK